MPLGWCDTCPACRAGNAVCHHLTSSASTPPGRCTALGPCPPPCSSRCLVPRPGGRARRADRGRGARYRPSGPPRGREGRGRRRRAGRCPRSVRRAGGRGGGAGAGIERPPAGARREARTEGRRPGGRGRARAGRGVDRRRRCRRSPSRCRARRGAGQAVNLLGVRGGSSWWRSTRRPRQSTCSASSGAS